MAYVIETSIIALVPGTFEGILAVALVLVYARTHVVNVSLGASGAIGTLLAAYLTGRIGVAPAMLVGLAACVAITVAITAAVSGSWLPAWWPLPSALTLVAALILEQVLTKLWIRVPGFPDLLPLRVIAIEHYQLTPIHVVGLAGGVAAVLVAVAVLRLKPGRAPSGDGQAGKLKPIRLSWTPVVLLMAGTLAFASASLTAQSGFGPGYMVAPAVVAFLAAALGLFRRPEIAFVAAVAIEVARNLSVRYDFPHAGYTSGVVIVAALTAALYAGWFLVSRRLHPV